MVRLYFDHNVSSDLLRSLRHGGHDIVAAGELALSAATDDEHLLRAAEDARTFLTYNVKDFLLRHDARRRWSAAWRVTRQHAGILILEQPPRLIPVEATREVERLLALEPPLSGELYRWTRASGWVRRP